MADLGSIFVKFGAETSGFTKGNKEVQTGIQQTGEHTSKLSGLMKGLGAAIIGALSVQVVISFGKSCVAAFDEGEKAAAKLMNAMKGDEAATKRLINQSESLQSKSLFGHDAIQEAQMFLSTMGMTESQITRMIPLLMDLSTKYGTDLTGSANIVSRAINTTGDRIGRTGILIEGASGSTVRFDSAVKNLTKSVGGLYEAATGAGVSGIKQMKELMDNIKELQGEKIAKFTNPGLKALKEQLELSLGLTQKNKATDIESAGRATVAQTKSIDEANVALQGYINTQKLELEALEAKHKAEEKFTTGPSAFGAGAGSITKNQNYEKNAAIIAGQKDALIELNKLANDPTAIEKLQKEGNASLIVIKNLGWYQEQVNQLTIDQRTQSDSEAKATQITINDYNKKIAAIIEYGKALTHEEQIKLKIDALNVTYDNTKDRVKRAEIQATIDLLQKDLDLEKQIRGENIGPITALTPKTQTLGRIRDYKQEASDQLQRERNLPLKPLAGSTLGPVAHQLKVVADAHANAREEAEKTLDVYKILNQVIGSQSVNAFDSLAQSLADLGTGQITVQTFFYKMLITVADFMKAFGAALVSAALASEAFQESLISNPYVALGAGIALIGAAAVVRSIGTKNLKGYADGGVFRSPTVGIFGEYPGARSNPEVAGKLSDLKQVFGGGSINGKLYIEGNDLVYVFGQALNRQARM